MRTLLLLFCIGVHTNGFGQNFSWAQGFGDGAASLETRTGAFDVNNNVFSLSRFKGTVDFDKGPNAYNLTAVGGWNLCLLKEDAAGNFIWAKHLAGLSSNVIGMWGNGVTLDSSGNIYLTGSFMDSFDFDPGPAVY